MWILHEINAKFEPHKLSGSASGNNGSLRFHPPPAFSPVVFLSHLPPSAPPFSPWDALRSPGPLYSQPLQHSAFLVNTHIQCHPCLLLIGAYKSAPTFHIPNKTVEVHFLQFVL